jgi:HlyD family secretion protein
MDVHISPGTFKAEEYGSMVGEIAYVSDVPTNKLRMVAVLADQDLVETFAREIGTPLETRVRLTGDPATFSGYRWTSSEGPPAKVTVGTLCRGSVTVKRQRPYELLVPYLVKKLGVD